MQVTLSLTRRQVSIFVAILVAVIGAGLAHAAIPDNNNVFTGCVKTTNGSVRIIDPSVARCTSNEFQVSWNNQGPAGPAGKDGINGLNGAPGLPGKDGAPGKDGVNGLPGKDGRDGVSVTSSALLPGDTNCPNGGTKLSSISGDTFICNGAAGVAGAPALTYIAGIVQPNGAVYSGHGFGCVRNSVGNYTITIPAPTFEEQPSVTATVQTMFTRNTAAVVQYLAYSTGALILTVDLNGVDTYFMFQVIPVS